MVFIPKFMATASGSMPFTDPARAVRIALESFPEEAREALDGLIRDLEDGK